MAEERLQKEEQRKKVLDEQIRSALEDESLPRIYFNGFINTVGIGDVTVILQQANKPVAILNMSYTLAKTLAEKLGVAIANIERESGNTIMTTDDIKQIFRIEDIDMEGNNDTE